MLRGMAFQPQRQPATAFRLLLLLAVLGAQSATVPEARAATSPLWGERGEYWTPQSRLPDFSFAGYQRVEKPLPTFPPGVSVKDFGARGDGQTDDTAAFQRALTEVRSGAIEVPPGRYRLTGLLEITRPNLVLRGAGPDRTVLFFPQPLNDIRPDWGATTTGQKTSNYSWSGGFVTLRGSFQSRELTAITTPARRGDQKFSVASTTGLAVGQEIEIYQTDTPDNTLAVHLYDGDSGPVENLKGSAHTSLISRIRAIRDNLVFVDRPLRWNLRTEWRPRLRAFEPTVTNSGVENLTFEFPVTPYRGHFTELGFNPLALYGVAHCWVRNVRVVNADSGPFVSGAFNTVEGLVLETARAPDGQNCTGHHGVSLGGTDNLLTNFDLRVRFIHDLTVSSFCSGNVVAAGRGLDLSLDHHRYAPHENLFTDLDAGAGTRLWHCGGGAGLGKHCGARGTFWNIRAARPLSYPPPGFGPSSINLVGLTTTQPSGAEPAGKWFEAIPPEQLIPRNLYEAQLHRRLGRPAE